MTHRRFAGQLIVAALAWAALCPRALAGGEKEAPLPGLSGPILPAIGAAPAPGLNVPNVQLPQLVRGVDAEQIARVGAQLTAPNASQIPGEQQKGLANELFEGARKASREDTAAVSGSESLPAPLAAPTLGANPVSSFSPPQARPAKPKVSLSVRAHYSRLWAENLYFYVVTNIVNKWAAYEKDRRALLDAGLAPAVSRPRAFFAYMRVMGQTGVFRVPGFTPREDAAVMTEARETFAKYFDSPQIGPRERAAFEGFLSRALVYNAERRAASKFRALVRDNMLKASVLAPAKIAPFFEGLPIMQKTAEFQNGAADAVRESFKAAVLEEIALEPREAKDRVTGIILIGSFALGAATPSSDFDVEPLTADGTSARVKGFSERLIKRWSAQGRQAANPITFHMFGYLNSRWELQQIHHEPYLIISPDQGIVDNLSARADDPVQAPSRELKPHGRVLRWLQYAAVYGTSLTVRAPK